jgi:hypothetical protein
MWCSEDMGAYIIGMGETANQLFHQIAGKSGSR